MSSIRRWLLSFRDRLVRPRDPAERLMQELDAGQHDAALESVTGEPGAAAPRYADLTPFDAQRWATR